MSSTWVLLAANFPVGRICLHVAAMTRDGQVKWHWAGIRREFFR